MNDISNTFTAEIIEIKPTIGSYITLYMLEYFGAAVKLRSSHSPEHLKVQLWTNILTKYNSEGNWHAVELPFQVKESEDIYLFAGSLMPTSVGNYQFTYRIGLKNDPESWQWLGDFQQNGCLNIEPPSESMNWTKGPNYIEIVPGVFVGNFIAASQAETLGIDAVLNLADELTINFPPDSKVIYQKINLLDGAHNPISDTLILEAVNWIDRQLERGKQKILVNCRAGIGRSGSVVTAYCFAKNPTWSYQQTLDYVWSKKPDIYPHKNLRDSLERIFPRTQTLV